MGSKRILKLTGSLAKQAACRYVNEAPEGYMVTIAEPTRNLEQSAKFHAMCGDIARQKPFAGQMHKPEQWKVLLVSGHSVATKQGSEMVPGLEGEWCNLRESTAKMSTKRMASLIEYVNAYCVENAIMLSTQHGG